MLAGFPGLRLVFWPVGCRPFKLKTHSTKAVFAGRSLAPLVTGPNWPNSKKPVLLAPFLSVYAGWVLCWIVNYARR